jgi:hypothetical protein
VVDRKIVIGWFALLILKAGWSMDPGGGCFGVATFSAFDTQHVATNLLSKLSQGSHPSDCLDRCSSPDRARHLKPVE